MIHSVSRVTCHSIPEVECGHVLTPVPDVQCQPVVNRDCRPVSVEIPYIEQEKQCDEVRWKFFLTFFVGDRRSMSISKIDQIGFTSDFYAFIIWLPFTMSEVVIMKKCRGWVPFSI